jgi:hypothetical protein
MLLDIEIKSLAKDTQFEILDLIGTIKNLSKIEYDFFIDALVNDYPELADKLQFEINTYFQEKN